MENLFKYSREELAKYIRNSEMTTDDIYWCPTFCEMLFERGNKSDKKYAYKRELFENRMYFKEEDIELFLSERKIFNLYEAEYYNKAIRFRKTNDDIKKLQIGDYVPGKEFTVGELIDCYEYIV